MNAEIHFNSWVNCDNFEGQNAEDGEQIELGVGIKFRLGSNQSLDKFY